MKSVAKLLRKALSIALSASMVAALAVTSAPAVPAKAAAGDVPAHSKTLTDNHDGTYQLELTVTGDADTDSELDAKANILVMVDTSNSMVNNRVGTGSNRPRRADAAEKVVYDFAHSLYSIDGADIQMSLMIFNHGSSLVQGWTKTETDITDELSATGNYNSAKLTYHSGTNYEVALQGVLSQLASADSDPTFVVFVTDGAPSQVSGTADGTFLDASICYGPSQDEALNIERYNTETHTSGTEANSNTKLYGIYAYGNEADYLDDVIYYAVNGTKRANETASTDTTGTNDQYFNASDTASLTAAIEAIFQDIVSTLGIAAVSIADGTTNSVVATSGPIELLEVDETSYKYWLSIPVINNQYTRVDPVSAETITYNVTNNGDGTFTLTAAGGTPITVTGTLSGGQLKFQWTEATELSDKQAPPSATLTNGEVDWNLNKIGTLLDGVTYSVTFDVYPSQETYDIIAQLKNGDMTWDDIVAEGLDAYIVKDGDSYSLRTNTNATLSYDDTRDDAGQQTTGYTNPDPVGTSAQTLTINKAWEGATPDVTSLPITVLMDDDSNEFHTATLSAANNWQTEAFISVGIIKNGQALPGALGHDFYFAELDDTQYRWELDAPTVRPMLVNGTLTMLIKVDADHPAPSGATTYTIEGSTYYVDSAASGLTATNYRRSNLNLTKTVTGEDAPEDATFPFTLTVNNSKAPTTEPTDDPEHNSDYWVWFSIYDTKAGATVMDATVSGATGPSDSGYYYAPSRTAISVQMKDGWNLRFTNLPSDTTYTFVEGALADGFAFKSAELTSGEDSTFSGGQTTTGKIENVSTSYYVTYTNDYQLTDLEITKVWEDANNQDGKRLTADELKAKLTLSPAVEGAEPTVEDNGDNTYTITYTGLPRYNNGQEVVYEVAESAIDGYTTEGSPAKDHGTITNTHTPEVTEVTVVKVWDDSDDIGKIRPASINAQLTADDAASGDPVALNAGNEWTYTWENLPKYKDGTEIVYSADETAVPAGYNKTGPVKTTAEDGTVTFTVTNTYNPTPVSVDPPVQKVITGNDKLYNKGDFTFTIAAETEGAPMPENTEITNSATYELEGKTGYYEFGEITFTMPGTYTYTITESGSVDGVTNDPDAATGKTITFTVTDDGKGNLVVSPTTDQVQLSFTNVYDADGEASIVVSKEITGAAWPAGKTLTLTIAGADGAPMPDTTTASLTAAGSVTFGPIAYGLTDAGKTYEYTITESSFGAGWTGDPTEIKATVAVTDKGDGTLDTAVTYSPENATFTNTYEATGKATIEATKAITGAAWPAGKSITFTLAGTESAPMPAAGGESVTLTAAGKATFGEISYTEADAGKTYTYTISEDGFGKGWTGSGDITVTVEVTDNGNGTLATEVTYDPADQTITNTYDATGEAVLKVTKEADVPGDATWPEGKTLTFTVTGSDGAPLPDPSTLTIDAQGEYSFNAIEYDESDIGKTYTYTITEDGFGKGWTGTPNEITATVKVTDNGDGSLKTDITYSPEIHTFMNTYEATGEAVLEATKAIEGADWPEGKTITFTLSGEDGTPLPETKAITLSAAGKATFDAITYDESDIGKTYTYTIKEDGFGTGWTAVPETITAKVEVSDNGDGTLKTDITYTPTNATITNKYQAEGTANISALKAIEGAAWPEDATITFTLAGTDGAPMPKTTEITLTEAGVADFGTISYSEADAGKTYVYTISEDGFGTGWTGSGSVTATVEVADKGDGTLGTTVTYSPEDATITNTYEATGSATLEATKAIEGAGWPEGKTITFTLTGEGGTLPATKTVTLSAPGKATFGAITYDESDAGKTYTYTISEDGFGDGWTGSGDVTATVKVTDNGDGTLKTEVTYSPEDATITNTYEATGSATLEATKAIEGAGWPEGKTITFTLTGEGGTLPATKTVTLSAPGKATFGAITYDESDVGKTYTYTISEDGFGDGWTGSGDVTATVKVTDNGDGTLKTEVTYSPEDATIKNTYKAAGSAVLEATKAIEGAAWPEGKTITFTLAGEGGTLPETKTVTLSEAGKATFGAIAYTEADAGKTYTYTISEDGFGTGWTGSGNITATVVVTDNGNGTLKTDITYTPDTDTITNTYKASGEIELFAGKQLNSAEGLKTPDVTEKYTLTLEGQNGAPMPEGATDGKVEIKNADGKGTMTTFGKIAFNEADAGKTYTYKVTETGTVAGVVNGTSEYTVTVEVKDNGDGTLTATATPDEETLFTNTYKVGSTTATFPVQKELVIPEGTDGPAQWSYTIDVVAGEGAPEADVMTGTVSNTNDTVTFGPFTYAAPGTYTYTVSETGTIAGVTNDEQAAGKTVTVNVVDNGDGTLTATASSTTDSPLKFTNRYNVGATTASFPVKKIMDVPEGLEGPADWSYTIKVEAQNGAPVVDTMTGTVTKAADTVTFGDFTYTAPGTYTYKVTETGTVAGVTNDSAAETGKTVTVTVVDNGDGTLTATASSTTAAPLTFTNSYLTDSTTVDALIYKKVDAFGSGWAGENGKTFEFSIEGAPLGMKDGVEVTTGTATFSQAGTQTVDFGTFTYTAPGTYTYTIAETTQSGGGWTCDNEEKTVTVTVTDKGDGTLVAKVSPEELIVTNVYNARGSIVLEGTKELYGSDEPVTLEEDTAIKATVESDGAVTEEPLKIALTAADEETQLSIDSEDIVIAEGGDIAETEGIIEEDAQQTVLFGAITFKKTGVYTFAASQIVEEELEGWTYDMEEKLITVEVTPGDGQLEATVTDNDPLFVNVYEDPNELAEVVFEIPAEIITKVEEDVEPVSQAFTLKIESEDEGVVIDTPEITSEEILAGESGQVVFEATAKVPVKAEEMPVYNFNVTQSDEEIEGWTLNVENEAVQTVEVRINKIEPEEAAEETEEAEVTFEAVVEGKPAFVNAYAPVVEEEPAEVSFQIPAEIITKIDEDIEAVSQAFTLYIASEDEGVEIGATEITTEEILAGESANVAFDVTVQVPADAEEMPVYNFTVAQADQEIEGWTLNAENDSEQTVTVRINKIETEAAEEAEDAEAAETVVTYEAIVEGTPVFVNTYAPAAEDDETLTEETKDPEEAEEGEEAGEAEDPEGKAAATEDPSAETPAAAEPGTEAPAEDAPATEVPAVETPVEAAPAVETPVEAAPAVETPVETAPVEETPAVETPVEAAPAVETPVETAPVEETPAVEAPVEAAPAVETPVEAAPVEETPAVEAPTPEAQPAEEPAAVEAVDGAAALWTTGYTNKIYLEGTETLVARSLKGGEFTFEVYYGETKVASGTNGAAEAGEKAKITFSEITFSTNGDASINVLETDEAGNKKLIDEIILTVKETATTMESIQENKQTFTVTLKITDNGDGTLSVSPAKEVDIAFVNYYITDVAKVPVSGTKEMVGRPLAEGEYTFTISVSPDGPLPEKVSVTNDANGGFDFGDITFGQADLDADGADKTYTYTITESGEYPGVTNDPTPKTFTVTVSDSGDGKIVAKSSGLEGIKFTNTYESKPVTTKVTTDIPVSKKLTGRELKEGEFTFELKDANGKVVSTASNDAAGNVEFGELTFDKVGDYTYTISEVSGNLGGVTYDTKIYDATAKVTEKLDENGKYAGELECKWTNSGGLSEIEFINTYVPSPVKVGFNVKKTLTGRELKAGEFTFKMTDSEGKAETATNAADGTITFPEKTFRTAGTYIFTVEEVNDGKGGITYDADKVTVTVTVTDDLNGKLLATVTPESVTFENTYAPKGTAAAITARKVMVGRALQDQEFSFVLKDSNGNVVAEAKNDAAGNVSFGTLNFDKPGEYNYTITERTDTGLNVIYDTSTKYVTVKVVDNLDGTMTATVTGNGQVFTNEVGGYEPPYDPPTPPTPPTIVPPTPIVPTTPQVPQQVLGARRGVLGAQRGVLGASRTGDDKNMMAWLGIMLAGIAALVGYILFMLKRKKSKAA